MTALAKPTSAPTLPRLRLVDSAVEALKWLGLGLMVLDHVNKYLLDWSMPWMFALGRLAMPIFAMTFGYNLARFEPSDVHGLRRILVRLTVAACVATLPFTALGKTSAGGWWPLNILATFAAAVAALAIWRSSMPLRRAAAALTVLTGGALGEFFWPAIGLVLATCSYARRPSLGALGVGLASLALLGLVNGNAWGLAALPLVTLASLQGHVLAGIRIPRLRWAFYIAYPAHLGLLWVVLQVRQGS